jgi:hypothetical protein
MIAAMARRLPPSLTLLWLCGCQAPPVSPAPERHTVPLLNEEQRQALWTASLDVLRSRLFEIDRSDLRAGVITTRPETSQDIVEFWRRDVATRYDLLEASMHTVRRWVEVRILTATDNHPEELQVAVYKERYNTIERQVTSSAGGLRVFDPDVPSTLGRRYRPLEDAYWTPVGRDSALESRLMQEILDRTAGL